MQMCLCLCVLGNTYALHDFPGSGRSSAVYGLPGTKLMWHCLVPTGNRYL